MATLEQGQGQLHEILGVVRRRALHVVVPATLVIALGASAAKLLPRKYTVKTGLELREQTLPLGGFGFDSKAIQRDISSTPWQIRQIERVRRVIEKLEWPDYVSLTPLEQYEYLRRVIKSINVSITAARNLQGSSLIEITYTDSDPQRAEQFLNRLRDAYTTEVLDRYRNEARSQLDILQNQRQLAEARYLAKEAEAAELKKRHGISATQQAPGGGRQRDEDPVFTRLSEAEKQLASVLAQIAADEAALATLKDQLKATPPELPETELRGGASFDDELAQIEVEIANQRERQAGLRPRHSVFDDAELKIRRLEEKRAQLTGRSTDPTATVRMVRNPQRDQLQTQIQTKELDLKQAEGQKAQLEASLAILRRQQAERVEVFKESQRLDNEVGIAQGEYAATSSAFLNQKRFVDLISQPYSNPFEVTEVARAPKDPASPNPTFVIGAAAALGLAAGLLIALATEFGRNAFRGAGDVARALSVPVLGVVNRIATARERRREQLRQALVLGSTAALVAGILWVTWAFENQPRLLGAELYDAIEGLRQAFR
jgi:uncharacterized protein involved in exopolysaccharide biosynthesis